MNKMQSNHNLDDFDLEIYKINVLKERIQKKEQKNRHVRDNIMIKISSFIIMIVFIILGGLLYQFLSDLLLKYLN